MATHTNKLKTNDRMLPQSYPLKSLVISPVGDKQAKKAGYVHCRGEGEAQFSPIPIQSKSCIETSPVMDSNTISSGVLKVFVTSKTNSPLMPCHPARARMLLRKKKAIVKRHLPFVLKLKNRSSGQTQEVSLKIDPGVKTTGIALTTKNSVLWLAEINHRRDQVLKAMARRKLYRRRRRNKNLRCRKPRFLNRKRKSLVAPSIGSILNNTTSWVSRLQRWCPITDIVMEYNSFIPSYPTPSKPQKTKSCAYCGISNTPLQIDHIIPKANRGSNRKSNLVYTCPKCNQEKGNLSIRDFLGEDINKLNKLSKRLQKPLDASAAINTYKDELIRILRESSLPLTLSKGEVTKTNRIRLGIPKTHALDAAFTGETDTLSNWRAKSLIITSMGRGSYARTRTDKFGFPRHYLPKSNLSFGFRTGYIVKSPYGLGRVSVRASGHFELKAFKGTRHTIRHDKCQLVQMGDGYRYQIS